MKVPPAVGVAIVLVVVTLYFVAGALNYDPVARAFPLIVGIPVLALLILQVLMQLAPRKFTTLRKLDTRELIQVDDVLVAQAKAVRNEGPKRGSELQYYAWAGAFVIAIYVLGFYAAIGAFLIGLVYFQLKERLSLTLMITAIMLVVAYYGFAVLMEVPLFTGILFQ
jgi:Tripartite tricarboxylate transporter TctB family